MARLVLLDRDGVINEDRPDPVRSPGELVLLPGAARAIARLNAADVMVVVVTNQSVVGKGLIPMQTLDRIHAELRSRLARDGARLDALLCCTDPPDRPTPRRKPGPQMLLEALRMYQAEAGDTPMIGDDLRDLQAARAAGCRRVLVRTGKGAEVQAAGIPPDLLPVAVRGDLASAVNSYLLGEL